MLNEDMLNELQIFYIISTLPFDQYRPIRHTTHIQRDHYLFTYVDKNTQCPI